MTTEAHNETPEFQPELELTDIQPQQLMLLDGHRIWLDGEKIDLKVNKTDDKTFVITRHLYDSNTDNFTIRLNPDNNKLYLLEENETPEIIQALIIAIKLLERGIDPLLPTHDCEFSIEDMSKVAKISDSVSAWVKELLARAINETKFGQNTETDTISIKLGDRDFSVRTLKELIEMSSRK